MALSKSSSHIPLLTSDGISVNGGTGPSNINGAYNQSFFTSRPYFTHAPSDYTSDGSISGAVNNSNNKVVMIGFDDGWKSQITYAKPILDKYGFKASFFVVCNYADSGNIRRMNWQDIAALQKDGMDIESHTMDHKPFNGS
ncbi:MAG: polysaccharide deacetylase family protein [Candidatus Nitrosopolaris sp.]